MFADRGILSPRTVLSVVAGLALLFALFMAAAAADVGAQTPTPTGTATTTTPTRTATAEASPPATGTGLTEDGGSSTVPLAVAGAAALAGGAALFGASRFARR